MLLSWIINLDKGKIFRSAIRSLSKDEDRKLCFSPEGRKLCFSPEGRKLCFSPEGRKLCFSPEGRKLCFSPEGRKLCFSPEGRKLCLLRKNKLTFCRITRFYAGGFPSFCLPKYFGKFLNRY